MFRFVLLLLLLPLVVFAADPLPDGVELEFAKSSDFCLSHCHAFSHDGKRVATAWGDKLKVWDAATRKLLYTHKLHESVRHLAWTPDGKLIGLAEWPGELFPYAWADEKDTGLPKEARDDLRMMADKNRLTVKFFAPVLSADGRRLAAFVYGDNIPLAVVVYPVTPNTSTRSCERDVSIPLPDCRFIGFSDDGKTLFTIQWSAKDGDRVSAYDLTAKDPSEPAWQLVFSREEERDGKTVTIPAKGKLYEVRSVDGKRVVLEFADPGCVIEVWDGPREKKLFDVSAAPYLQSSTREEVALALSPDGKRLAVSAREKSGLMGGVVCDLSTGKEVVKLTAGPGDRLANVLRYRPDGKRLYRDYMEWDAEAGNNLTPVGHHAGIATMMVSGDGKTIVTAGYDFTARGWDAKTGKEKWLACFPRPVGELRRLDGDTAVASPLSYSQALPQSVLDLNTGKLSALPGDMAKQRKVKVRKETRTVPILPVAISPDGKTAVSVDQSKPAQEVWNWKTGKRRKVLPFDAPAKMRLDAIQDVAFSADSKELVVVSCYNEIHPPTLGVCGFIGSAQVCLERWSIAKGEQLERISYKKYTPAGLASNGKRCVLIRLDKVADVDTGEKLLTPKKQESWYYSEIGLAHAALSPDGNTLVMQVREKGKESKIRWYDLKSKKLLAARQVDASQFAFLPDGRLVSAGESVCVWKAVK